MQEHVMIIWFVGTSALLFVWFLKFLFSSASFLKMSFNFLGALRQASLARTEQIDRLLHDGSIRASSFRAFMSKHRNRMKQLTLFKPSEKLEESQGISIWMTF